MARQHGPKTRLSKRVGRQLFLKGARSFGAKDDFTKRPYRSGVHGKGFSKTSEYSLQLTEKQAVRFTYGLTDKQLKNVFTLALHSKGETGVLLLTLLERRLDNVVYRAGLANSRSQARQLVNHGHFTLNGIRADIPSMLVKTGDVVTVKANKLKSAFWTNFKLEVPNEVLSWMSKKDFDIKILNEPLADDLPKDFKIPYVVEYFARRVK
jgi:small subunit ribosomal protein S4